MNYIKFGYGSIRTEQEFGRQLAKLHLYKGSSKFGFEINNKIGFTPQINTWYDNWVEFFINNRIKYQLDIAKLKYPTDISLQEIGEQLIKIIPSFFEGITITPSLLHGDLWTGNYSVSETGQPIIYDPACYWGHNEAELGIMKMFGGFSSTVFDEYHKIIPKEKGFEDRQSLYILYHTLNHLNLFGSSYSYSVLSIMKQLLSKKQKQ